MENNTPYFQQENRPKRPVKWIMLSCTLLVAGCIVAAASLGNLPFAPTPAPTPTATPLPTPAPTALPAGISAGIPEGTPETTPEPSPTPNAPAADYDTTAIIIDGEVAGALASLEAAQDVMNNAISFFELKITQPGALTSEIENEVEYVSANTLEGVRVYSYEDMLERLTAENTPLKVASVLKESHTDTVEKTVKTEKNKYLIKGTSLITKYGSDGKTATVTTTRFINGEVHGEAESETFELSSRVDMVIRTGTQKAESGAEPGKKEGEKGPDKGELTFIRPMKRDIELNFGQSDGIMHLGLDFEAKEDDEVLSACAGTVVSLMERGGYGLVIEIAHENGFLTRYAHLATALCSLGDTVAQGQRIAIAGSSGNCKKPHLHFELRCNGIAYNPRFYFD